MKMMVDQHLQTTGRFARLPMDQHPDPIVAGGPAASLWVSLIHRPLRQSTPHLIRKCTLAWYGRGRRESGI